MGRGRDVTQKVKLMKQNFMDYYRQGMNIPQIARYCGLTTTTVYSYLDEIAKENGFSDRTDLLERIHPKHVITVKGNRRSVADFDEVVSLAKELNTKISNLIATINAI